MSTSPAYSNSHSLKPTRLDTYSSTHTLTFTYHTPLQPPSNHSTRPHLRLGQSPAFLESFFFFSFYLNTHKTTKAILPNSAYTTSNSIIPSPLFPSSTLYHFVTNYNRKEISTKLPKQEHLDITTTSRSYSIITITEHNSQTRNRTTKKKGELPWTHKCIQAAELTHAHITTHAHGQP